jgi:hypothetical protein
MKKSIKLFCAISFSLILAFIWNNISYGKLVILTFDEVCKKAEVIIIGQVLETNSYLLTEDEATIEPESVIKGIYKNREIRVRYGSPFYYVNEDMTKFVVGEEYVLFLRQYEGAYHAVGAQQGVYPIQDGKFILKGSRRETIESFIGRIKSVISR